MQPNQISTTGKYETSVEINRVLRNTYFLLSLTLLFSAAMAVVAMVTNATPINIWLMLLVILGFPFIVTALRNSPWGILAVFGFTGILGYSIGPILNAVIQGFSNGTEIVMASLGTTGLIFVGLSGYTIVTRKNFSYLGGFIAVAALSAFVLALGGIFFNMPILNLAISGAFAVISSAYILYTTSEIINGGERNYIMATMSLYIAIFNLFMSLLRILSFFAGNRN